MNTERRRRLTGIASQLHGLKEELKALQSEGLDDADMLQEAVNYLGDAVYMIEAVNW